MAGGWNEMVYKVPANPYHSCLFIMVFEPLEHLIASVVAPLGEAGRRGLLSQIA